MQRLVKKPWQRQELPWPLDAACRIVEADGENAEQ
jgi:hypothetical protein